MTAEICIMNRLAISLAADSAVTIGYGADKIYTSAEKLFLLAENAPVGLMVYQAADLLDVPWETIIKIYRKRVGRKTFATLQDYVDDFISFLDSERVLFNEESQKYFIQEYTTGCFGYLRNALDEQLNKKIEKDGTIDDSEIRKTFVTVVKNELIEAMKIPLLDNLPEGFYGSIEHQYQSIIDDAREQFFGKLPIYKSTRKDLTKIVIENLIRKNENGNHSGMVIAGFGEVEHLPSQVATIVKGVACNHILCYKSGYTKVKDELSGAIIPFAQQEMVITFMEGIDPDIRSIIEGDTKYLFHGVAEEIFKAVKEQNPEFGDGLHRQVSKNLDTIIEGLITRWKGIRENYASPVVEIVSVLPKDELAAMAESLINLTKFKRRVSMQKETVGGPIDVSVITKGDGFVWVKRRYYFDGKLNPRFMARYSVQEE